MSNIVIFGAPHSGKTTLLGYLSTAMLRHPQFNEEILRRLKLIKKLGMEDDFHIGDPYNPIHIRKDIILPSFVSLDRDELRKFTGKEQNTLGSSKRLHHKQLTLCMSERKEMWNGQNENENISCTFIDLPGFRQRISDKYRGFFEGDIGLAVLDIAEVLKLEDALKHSTYDGDNLELIEKQERKLFEPVRIWCDYRSSKQLVIVLSKIDQQLTNNGDEEGVCRQYDAVQRAVQCIRDYTRMFGGENIIPIVPTSIRITQEENNKTKPRMKVFFHREEENIYAEPEGKSLPGDGTLIACLKRLLEPYAKGTERVFSMASVDRPMSTIVNYARKTALQICAVHGTLHNTDIVSLGPILNKRTNEICYARCTIASLKADGAKEPCPMLLEGNVGGIIFKSITNLEGRASDKYVLSSTQADSDIRILRSTILFTGDILQGDVITLEIYKKEYLTINGEVDALYSAVLQSLMPNDEMIIFWYGKKILVKVIEIHFLADRLSLSVILSHSQHNLVPHFALPCDENGEIQHCDNVLLAIPDTNFLVKTHPGEPTYTYFSACLKGIKNSDEYDAIRIKCDKNLWLASILKGNFPFELVEDDAEQEIIQIPIRSNQKKYCVDAVLSRISRNLKNNYNRLFYWSAGGVEMHLVKSVETMITKTENMGKDIYFFKSHHFALLPWAECKMKMPEDSIYLVSFDHHTDTIDPFSSYCNNDVEKMKRMLANIDYRKVETIKNAIEKLSNDEHICTAINIGIIEGVYIVSYLGNETPCSYEEEKRLKDPFGREYLDKIIAGENVITPQIERTYPQAKIHCADFMPWGMFEMGDEYDSEVLEDSFLEEKFRTFSRMSPNIVSYDGSIKGKYILDIDLDYFHKLSALTPSQYNIFSRLVRNAEIITIAEESTCVELVRADEFVDSDVLKKKLTDLLTQILKS